MSEVKRICPQCSGTFPMDARHCAHCGYNMDATLPVPQSSLPELVSKAAVPVLVGAASLAVSVGWKLLQGMLSQPARPKQQPLQARPAEQVQPRSKMTVRITTSWAVGDSNGNWREGRSEQTIEFD